MRCVPQTLLEGHKEYLNGPELIPLSNHPTLPTEWSVYFRLRLDDYDNTKPKRLQLISEHIQKGGKDLTCWGLYAEVRGGGDVGVIAAPRASRPLSAAALICAFTARRLQRYLFAGQKERQHDAPAWSNTHICALLANHHVIHCQRCTIVNVCNTHVLWVIPLGVAPGALQVCAGLWRAQLGGRGGGNRLLL